MSEAGLGYVEASKAYEAMTSLIEEGVVNARKINFGRVLSLNPTMLEPRPVHMNFERGKEGVQKTEKVYYLGRRVRYKVNLFKEFVRRTDLHWL